MSVHWVNRHGLKPTPPVATPAVTARMLLSTDHPLHGTLVKWVGNKPLTLRQASKFLQKYPMYRQTIAASPS